MRRPHPLFDEAVNVWVTKAGGTLMILAKGPKNAESGSIAWDAFYAQSEEEQNLHAYSSLENP